MAWLKGPRVRVQCVFSFMEDRLFRLKFCSAVGPCGRAAHGLGVSPLLGRGRAPLPANCLLHDVHASSAGAASAAADDAHAADADARYADAWYFKYNSPTKTYDELW